MPSALPFTATETDSEFVTLVNIPPDAKTLTIELAGTSVEPVRGLITSVLGVRVPATAPHKPPSLVLGYQIGNQYNRRKIDQGDGSLAVGRFNAWWPGHFGLRFDIDLAAGTFHFADDINAVDAISGHCPNAPRALGETIAISIGQTGVADDAYFPPYGWRFDGVAVAVDGRQVFASPAATTEPIEPSKPTTPPAPAIPDPSNPTLLDRLTETVSTIAARLAGDHDTCRKIAAEIITEVDKH